MGRSSRRRRRSVARAGGGGGEASQPASPVEPEKAAASRDAPAGAGVLSGGVSEQIEAKPAATEPAAGPTSDEVRGEPATGPLDRPALLGPAPLTLSSAWSAATAHTPASVRARLRRVHRWARRSRTRIAWGVVLALSGASVAALAAMTLARSAPRWWTPMEFRTTEMRELARLVENGAISHITADHQGSGEGALEAVVWPVKLSDDGANAWLQLRLPVWLPKLTAGEFREVINERGEVVDRVPIDGLAWPEAVSEVRAAFKDGRFRIGASVGRGADARYFSATLAPEIREDGSLWMRATSVSIGRLTLPAWLVLGDDGGLVRGWMPPELRETAEAEAIFEKLAGLEPVFEDAVIRLGDGRRVRLLSLAVGEASLVAQFRTEWGGPNTTPSADLAERSPRTLRTR